MYTIQSIKVIKLLSLKKYKYWLASLFSRFKSNRECIRNNDKKNKIKRFYDLIRFNRNSKVSMDWNKYGGDKKFHRLDSWKNQWLYFHKLR